MATGGTGKSRLLLHMMISLATGTPFGPFRPAAPKKVLYLCGEDPAEILHERIFHIARGMGIDHSGVRGRLLRENFRAVPMVGTDRFLIGFDPSGNPATTATYEWLSGSLEKMGKVDLLVIDPLSRFYGLDENNNPHGTAWVACLEALAKKHGLAVLFSHHSSKAVVKDGDPKKDTGRGASAIHDGVRVLLSLGSTTGEALGVHGDDGQGFIELHHVKGNYSPLWGKPFYFKKGPGLALTPTDPQEGIRGRQVAEIVELLPEKGLTERDLLKGPAGKDVRIGLKDVFPKLNIQKEVPLVLTLGVETGQLERIEVTSRGRNGLPVCLFKVPKVSAETAEIQRKNPVSAEQREFSETAMGTDSHSGNSGYGHEIKAETAETQRKNSVSAETEDQKPIATAETIQRKNPVSADPRFRCNPSSEADLVAKNLQRKCVTPKGEGFSFPLNEILPSRLMGSPENSGEAESEVGNPGVVQ